MDTCDIRLLEGSSGNRTQRRFRQGGGGLLFDNLLNIEGLRLKGLMENGYEEGCTRGANKFRGLGNKHLIPFFCPFCSIAVFQS